MIFKNPIDSLSAKISERGGLAKPNYFAVTFTGPASINPNIWLVNALCESASLPGRAFSTAEYTTTKHAVKVPYTFINDDVTLTFLVTNDFYMKNLFEKWMKCVINDEDGKIYYKKQYASDFTITVLSPKSQMIHKVTLQNAYPITMSAIELSNAAENQVMKVTVTLTYDNYKTNTTFFSLATSLADLRDALSFPNPLMPSVPFSPFGDLGSQGETILAGLKSELAGELTAQLNSITSILRDKIGANTSSITTVYQGGLGSIVSQVSGKVQNIFGSSLSGAIPSAGGALINAGKSVISRGSAAVKGLFG
jgi:hypothetical protein